MLLEFRVYLQNISPFANQYKEKGVCFLSFFFISLTNIYYDVGIMCVPPAFILHAFAIFFTLFMSVKCLS